MTMFAINTHDHEKKRQGAALIMAVIALILCTSICLSITKTTLLRQSRYGQRLLKSQAALIADSALERAFEQLQDNPGYTGEIWTVTVNEQQGTATIQLEKTESADVKVTVVARYPNTNTGVQSTIETFLTAPVAAGSISP